MSNVPIYLCFYLSIYLGSQSLSVGNLSLGGMSGVPQQQSSQWSSGLLDGPQGGLLDASSGAPGLSGFLSQAPGKKIKIFPQYLAFSHDNQDFLMLFKIFLCYSRFSHGILDFLMLFQIFLGYLRFSHVIKDFFMLFKIFSCYLRFSHVI